MPEIYQFIKYNSATSGESIRKKTDSGAVICFDLEDSIFDWINGSDNLILKQKSRNELQRILEDLQTDTDQMKMGIRINTEASGFQSGDIECFPKGVFIHSVFLPKVEESLQIDKVARRLEEYNIRFREIIPVIESEKGLKNLENIIQGEYPVRKIAFGHCDYNLSIGAFPFFHHDSLEYWKWVKKIAGIIRGKNILFLNSPLLKFDPELFQSVLLHLQLIFGEKFGVITLHYEQTIAGRNYQMQSHPETENFSNRLNLRPATVLLHSFISKFEKGNKGQGFTILSGDAILSPQEYFSAKQHLKKQKEQKINITYVGGCFPVQMDIPFEDLFHQKLKRKLEKKFPVNVNINIIRYERFTDCLHKIDKFSGKDDDHLIFHIRPEPFLRLVKLYYKCINDEGKLQKSLNLPFLGMVNPEKYDMLTLSRIFSDDNSRKQFPAFHKMLVDLNYGGGWLAGNYKYALRRYLRLIHEIKHFCDKNSIHAIFVGPAIRSCTPAEIVLSGRLNKFMHDQLKKLGVTYVEATETLGKQGDSLFPDGSHASEEYHELIADKLVSCFG